MGVLDRFRLDGKRLFITGGSRGLGRAMALAIADAGADVVLVGRDRKSLENTAAEIREFHRQAFPVQGDVSIPAECERICEQALAAHGPIDILINNVGGRRFNIPTQDMPLDTWRQMMDLNLTCTFLCTKLIGGAMVARGKGGRVINIASISGLIVNRNIAGRHYEAAKAAVIHVTRAVAADWAPHGVTVNAILPGGFATDVVTRWMLEAPEATHTFKAQIPMGDMARPEDIGPLAVFLASEGSRYMTGSGIVIDGGYTLW